MLVEKEVDKSTLLFSVMLKCMGILQFLLEFLISTNTLLKSYISYISISKLDLFLLLSSIFLGEQLFHSKQHNSQEKKVKAGEKTCQTTWSDWNSGWRRWCWRELCASARLTSVNRRWTNEVSVVILQIPFHGPVWFKTLIWSSALYPAAVSILGLCLRQL